MMLTPMILFRDITSKFTFTSGESTNERSLTWAKYTEKF